MAELQPDPGPAQAGSIVMISAETWNAIRHALKPLRGAAEQIDVNPAGDGGNFLSFASERQVTIIQNGAAVNVIIPIRNA